MKEIEESKELKNGRASYPGPLECFAV